MPHSKEEVIKLLKGPSCKVCAWWDHQAYRNYDQKLGWCEYYDTQPVDLDKMDLGKSYPSCKGFINYKVP